MASPVARPVSDTPEAKRARDYRARKRERSATSPGVTNVTQGAANDFVGPAGVTPVTPVMPPAPPAPVASSAPAPWHETQPDDGGGPEQFAVPLILPANDNVPDAKPEPFAEAAPLPPEAPPAPLSSADVLPMVTAVVEFFEAGATIALFAYGSELGSVGMNPQSLYAKMPTIKEMVRASTERVCQKYRIRFPYQDEAIVAGAIGIAALGFTKGAKRLEEAAKNAPPQAAPTENAAAAAPYAVPPMPASDAPITKPAPAPARDVELDA